MLKLEQKPYIMFINHFNFYQNTLYKEINKFFKAILNYYLKTNNKQNKIISVVDINIKFYIQFIY